MHRKPKMNFTDEDIRRKSSSRRPTGKIKITALEKFKRINLGHGCTGRHAIFQRSDLETVTNIGGEERYSI